MFFVMHTESVPPSHMRHGDLKGTHMRTVDALIAARDFFTSDPCNWTHGGLSSVRGRGKNKHRFCAIGGISLVTGCLKENGLPARDVVVSSIAGPIGVRDINGKSIPIGALPKEMLRLYSREGVELLAAHNAIRYAEVATRQLHGDDYDLVAVNDTAELGYPAILRILDTAIKNAKRRHIKGSRY